MGGNVEENMQSKKENQSDLEIGDPVPELGCFFDFLRNDLERVIAKAMLYIRSEPRVIMVLYPHYCRWNGDRAFHSMAIVEIAGKHYSVEIDEIPREAIYVRSKDFGIIRVYYDWDTCKSLSVFTEIPNEPGNKELKEFQYHGEDG